MISRTQEILDKARTLLKKREYTAALDTLKRITAENLAGVDLGVYYLTKGEVLLFLGDYRQDFLEKAIEVFKGTAENRNFAHAKYLHGWQLQSIGAPFKAKQPLIESYTAFLRIDDYNSAARALNRLAMISVQAGEISQAVDNLSQAIAYYDRGGNHRLRDALKVNLASVHLMSGQLTQAIQYYVGCERFYEIFDSKTKCVYGLCRSLTTALSGDFAGARKMMRLVAPHLTGLRREEAQYHEYLGWISILDGDYDGAEKALTKGLRLSVEIAPESALISQIKRLLGDLYFATGKQTKAAEYARQALAVAEKINERVEIAACYRIFAQLDCLKNKKKQAKEWFKKALDLFNLIESRYELAVTRYLAAKSGLYDQGERTALLYLAKEYFESEKIKHYIDRVQRELSAEYKAPRTGSAAQVAGGSPIFIAGNPVMKKILSLAENVASSDMSVLLTGETGTGKDLVATYIHHHSGRKGEFVTVNSAAIPTSMVESELFGYAKGAFTGADKDKAGLFEMADSGTFYLNEVADATPEFQAKLLEVLETRQIRRLGETKRRQVGFRLIAATNHDLNQRMRDGRFRCDLYHRLNEIPIHLPPLANRTDDIGALVSHFLREMGLDVNRKEFQETLKRLSMILEQRSWPGNVRELLAHVKFLRMASGGAPSSMIDLALGDGSREESDKLVDLLNLTGWNRSTAAMILGVTEGTIRSRIRKYGLKP